MAIFSKYLKKKINIYKKIVLFLLYTNHAIFQNIYKEVYLCGAGLVATGQPYFVRSV